MKTKNTIAVVLIVVLSATSLAVNACSDDTGTSSTNVGVASLVGSEDETVTAFAETLEEAIPTWDAELIGSVPSDAATTSIITDAPLDLLSYVSEATVSYVGKAHNGEDIYTNAEGNVAVKVDAAIGYWKFVTPPVPVDVADVDKLTDEAAFDNAENLFASLGLPEQERGGHVAVGVGEADQGPEGPVGVPHATARHVRLFREINGLSVWNSHLMVTYDLTGQPFRLELRWPTFRLAEGAELIDREQVIADIAEKLAGMQPTSDDGLEVQAYIKYVFDEQTAVFSPTLFVYQFVNDEPLPAVLKYSLVDGFAADETSATSDM